PSPPPANQDAAVLKLREDRPAARARIVRTEDPGERFELDPASFPFLSAAGRNLTALAARGLVEPIVGRDKLVEQVLDVLAKRRANCPCLVGLPGVGKTTLVDGVARALVGAALARPSEPARALVSISVVDLVAGTGVRGALSERMRALIDEVARASGRIILFLDQIHALFAADQTEDAATDLKAAMARGELPCIGATTPGEYRKHVESDASLERRFTRIDVDEPSPEDALEIVRGAVRAYAEHHAVGYDDAALEAAVTFGVRHIPSRCLPDKAISLLDLAGARAHRRGARRVDRAAVAHVVADVANVPVERLLHTDADRLLALEEHLSKSIVGHRPVLSRISDVLRRNAAGFRGKRPIGTFLFLGPTGVGKTETAKAVAEMLFPGAGALARFDMAEMSEAHAVARLVGAPPGYVGHDEGGQLTEAVRRRPYQLVLLDEIEKAHRDVVLALLGVLDEGRMTDGRGRTVDFTNTVIVMTSNLGASVQPTSNALGFSASSSKPTNEQGLAGRIVEAARSALAPELWNRIDEPLVFMPLSRDEVAEVARRLVAASGVALQRDQGIRIELDESAIGPLLDAGGYDLRLGARPMRRTVQRLIEAPIAELVLRGGVRRGASVVVRGEADRVVVVPA
ncbi:MAG: ATP-dependent Clp protease ATP-binding subunit, partial [Deltaproteobacteria bacterium]|nr:ATP-dependent Clp protease ATP-binding subunit [Deltaproteobacteria bacterium]